MRPILKISFNKQPLLDELSSNSFANNPSITLDQFKAITQSWLTTKFYHIIEILPSYHGIEYIDFLTKEDITPLANGSLLTTELLCNALQILIHDVVTKNIIKPNLQIRYDMKQGTIHITYSEYTTNTC